MKKDESDFIGARGKLYLKNANGEIYKLRLNKTFQPTVDKSGLVFILGVVAPAAERPRYVFFPSVKI